MGLHKNIMLAVMMFVITVEGQVMYIDTWGSVQSGLLRDGRILSRRVSMAGGILAEFPGIGVWADVRGLGEGFGEGYGNGEISINKGKGAGAYFFTISGQYYGEREGNPGSEWVIAVEREGKIPVGLRLKYSEAGEYFYTSADTYSEMEWKLPLFLSFKGGWHIDREGRGAVDAEAALSTYMSVGSYQFEPFFSVYVVPDQEKLGVILNMSISKALFTI